MPCDNCQTSTSKRMVIFKDKLLCGACRELFRETGFGVSATVIGDDIPGGVEIKHGICNEDGTPKRYYSKSEIRQAAYNAGYFQGDDTPKSNPRLQEERAKQREARERG